MMRNVFKTVRSRIRQHIATVSRPQYERHVLITPVVRKSSFCTGRKQSKGGDTLSEQMNFWTRTFKKNGIPEPDLTAGYIVAHVMGQKEAFFDKLEVSELYAAEFTQPLSSEQLNLINELCKKRLQRMPLQYVLGEWDFRDLTLKLRPPVFIPRPETEELVEMILQYHRPRINLHFLEVGCGSGAISLSLLHEIPQAIGIAIDQSHAAVKLTEHNATRLNLHDRLTVHNIEVVDSFKIPNDIAGPYDAIISNPPYIFHDDMKDLAPEISRYEDTKALHGGHDGLEVTKNILKMARYLLKHEGSIWFECDPRHPTMIKSWLDNHPETDVKFVDVGYDFSDRARFCHLKYIPTKVKT